MIGVYLVLCAALLFGVHGRCPGDLQWNECGSACDKTCDEPTPMCTMMCVARCECPRDTPILLNPHDTLNSPQCGKLTECRGCPGDLQWNDCGSACEKTCDTPSPVCSKICVARCECPRDAPILLNPYDTLNSPQCGEIVECPGQIYAELSAISKRRVYVNYNPTGLVLPANLSIALTTEDIQDLITPDVTEEELAQEVQETLQLATEIDRLKSTDNIVEKRGITSVIVWTVTVGSNSYQFYNLVTSGCGSFPSICDDKAKIEELTHEIDTLKNEYDTLYVTVLKKYLDLLEIMENNGYINYYINKSLDILDEINAISKKIVEKLDTNLIEVVQTYGADGLTADEFLSQVIWPLNMGLKDVERILAETEKGSSTMLALNVASKMLITDWLDNYASARNLIAKPSDGRLDNIVDPPMTEEDKEKLSDKPTAWQQSAEFIKGGMASISSYLDAKNAVVKKTFSNMASSPFVYMSSGVTKSGVSRKYFSPRRIFNNFKFATIAKTKGLLTKLKTSWTTLRDDQLKKFSTTGFKVKWASTLTDAIGVALDIMSAAESYNKYKELAEEMSKQRSRYEEYKNNLVTEKADLDADLVTLEREMDTEIGIFKDITGVVKSIIERASEHSEVVDATSTTFDYPMTNPVLSTDFLSDVDEANIKSKQHQLISFVNNDVKKNFHSAKEMLDGRWIFYDKCTADFVDGIPVKDTLAALKQIMTYSGSSEKVRFGNDLSVQDVVCFHALVQGKAVQYDFYDLTSLRPTCDVTEQEWVDILQGAKQNRYAHMVTEEVQIALNAGETSVNEILQDVVQEFTRGGDSDMATYASRLTTKDILCVIARVRSEDYFDFFELTLFRNYDCSAITDNQFVQAETAASDLRQKELTVKAFVDVCRPPANHCFCFSVIQQAVPTASESEVKMLIKKLNPNLSEWCASDTQTTTCNPLCVTL